jgi:transposase-like protein
MANTGHPETLQDAVVYFSDPERAFVYAVNLRWPDGVIRCPRCGGDQHTFTKTRLLWFCKKCQKQFTIKVGTIWEDSPIGLDKWMVGMWMLVNCKNGISSWELHRVLGITQKSAWFMLHRLRLVLKVGSLEKRKLGGNGNEVEVDETFVGGKAINMHKARRLRYEQMGGHHGKTIVQGILDRDLRQIRCTVVPNIKRETLQNEVLHNVRYGTTVYTDNAVGYDEMHFRFVHDFVNHAERYVNGRVHTNGLENFWSLMKRGLKGTYVAVEPFHLSRYVDEQVFRFNNRKTKDNPLTDSDRFVLAMSRVGGKRLTYCELTGKDADALHTSTAGTGQAEPF